MKKKKSAFLFPFFLSLQTTTTSSRLASGRVGWDWCNVLDASNLQSVSGKGTEGGLGSRSRAACLGSSGSSDLDVEGGDAQFLALFGDILGGKHSSVRRGFVSVGLDLHSSGDSDKSFPSGQVSDVNECVIEGGKQVSNSEDFFSVLDAETADFLGSFFTTSRFDSN